MYKCLILLFLLAQTCLADTYIKYGIGISKDQQLGEVKVIAGGYQTPIYESIISQIELGYWSDPHLGRKSSIFGNVSFGLDIQAGILYTQALWGIALISQTDSILGGNFQFNHDIFLGLRDKNGYSIGIGYKHISSAGIYMPNLGRDMLMIKMAVPY